MPPVPGRTPWQINNIWALNALDHSFSLNAGGPPTMPDMTKAYLLAGIAVFIVILRARRPKSSRTNQSKSRFRRWLSPPRASR
jgi:hypothetical protein